MLLDVIHYGKNIRYLYKEKAAQIFLSFYWIGLNVYGSVLHIHFVDVSFPQVLLMID
jgi:hypothetical protein